MTKADEPRFARVITALGETFDKQVSIAVIGMYFETLKDLPIEAVERAAFACLKTCKFMPRPAELRERSGVGEKSAEDRSMIAWVEVRNAVESIGAYRSAEVYDPCTAAAIEAMGGWIALCCRDDEPVWIEREFRRYYQLYASQGLTSDGPMLMLGIHETENGPNVKPQRRRIGGPKVVALPPSRETA